MIDLKPYRDEAFKFWYQWACDEISKKRLLEELKNLKELIKEERYRKQ